MKKFLFILNFFTFCLFAQVDINKATFEELISVKGIGKSKANAIIEYRKQECFKNIDDLINIKGISKKQIEKVRDLLIATDCN